MIVRRTLYLLIHVNNALTIINLESIDIFKKPVVFTVINDFFNNKIIFLKIENIHNYETIRSSLMLRKISRLCFFKISGRRRHRFRRVIPVVVGIYMTITVVLILLFFQFMAMMGGKVFIVGKLALIFALLSNFSKFFSTAYGEISVYSTIIIIIISAAASSYSLSSFTSTATAALSNSCTL